MSRFLYVGLMNVLGGALGLVVLAVLLILGLTWGITTTAAIGIAILTWFICFLVGWILFLWDPAGMDR